VRGAAPLTDRRYLNAAQNLALWGFGTAYRDGRVGRRSTPGGRVYVGLAISREAFVLIELWRKDLLEKATGPRRQFGMLLENLIEGLLRETDDRCNSFSLSIGMCC
jgi:hypothetical protein